MPRSDGQILSASFWGRGNIMNAALATLRYHVTGAIERGEALPIIGVPVIPTFAEYVALRDSLDATLVAAGVALTATRERLARDQGIAAFGAMGLTPDSIKMHPDYRRDKVAVNVAFEHLRTMSGCYAKRFAKEIRAEIQAKRERKLALRS
jgi:hypothetical protein